MSTSNSKPFFCPAGLFLALCTLALYVGQPATAQQTSQQTQEPPHLVNSGEILEEAQKLHDDGHYKEALALYRQVSPSDTNYSRVLYELSFSSYMDSNFAAGKQYADEGLQRFPEDAASWHSLSAQALEGQGYMDSALAEYNRALAINPYSYLGFFNKGLCFYRLKRYKEAKACFQRCVVIYPYQTSAHYYLGMISIQEGNPVPAMYSLMTSLVINPQGRYAKSIVRMLNNIATVNDEVSGYIAAHKAGEEDDFETAHEILLSKAALDKQYPLHSEVEDVITRQMQVLLEKTDFQEGDKGFWMQYYVPFYKDVFTAGEFNTMIHEMLGGLGIKSVDEWSRKHESIQKDFVQHAVNYFQKIAETELLPYGARDTATLKYLVENEALSGKGYWKDSAGKKWLSGPWEFYFHNGRMKSKGLLNDQGNKQGYWTFYFNNGAVEEQSTFEDGKAVGKSVSWYDNGIKSEEDQYVGGELDGDIRTWYYNGQPRITARFTQGKRNGWMREYSSDGFLQSTTWYKEDEKDSISTYYFSNGLPSSIQHYTQGKEDGPLQKFNIDGVLLEQAAYANGKETGDWKTFYPSAHVHETFSYARGVLQGEYMEYYDNGQIKERLSYVNGKPEGKEFGYTEGGRQTYEDVYEKGKIREVQYFTPEGNPFPPSSIRGGEGFLVFYDSLGSKEREGAYTKLGNKEGKMTYFTHAGQVSGYAFYKDDENEGPRVNFFPGGQMSDSTVFSGGNENGHYAWYYENGRIKQEGWYVDGERTGPYTEYDALGNITLSVYYRNGSKNGYLTSYAPNGRKVYEYLYESGWPARFTQWDTAGRMIYDHAISAGDSVMVMKHMNGNDDARGQYRHLANNGPLNYYYFDRSLNTQEYFKDGLQDSVYRQYYYGGQLGTEGMFRLGSKEGVWTGYYENGRPKTVQHYHADELTGVSTYYNDDGTLLKEFRYVRDEREGPQVHYGDSSRVSYILYYHYGDLIGYSYQSKDGKPVPMIPLAGGSGMLTAWYANGQKSAEFRFTEGAVDGLEKLWYSNGEIYFTAVEINGKDQGMVKWSYPNGKPMAEENNYYDNLHGVCRLYYPGGVLRSEENYYNGDQEGVSKYYDETGHLKQTRVYYYGVLQAVY